MGLRSDIRIFFWLPKTAGGTLATGIRDNAQVKWLFWTSPDEMPAPSSSDQVWFGGHLHFGHHLFYNAVPEYFTILRDPIERLISEFFYHHGHQLPGIFIPENEIVSAFVRLIEAVPHLNYYSYMFSAYCVEKEIADQNLPSWNDDPTAGYNLIVSRDKRYGYLTENIPFHKINAEGAFLRALHNALSMRFIGFFDRLHDSTTQLKREFGLNVGLNVRMHETAKKPKLDDLPGHITLMLKRKTEADYEFFHRARRCPVAALPRIYQFR